MKESLESPEEAWPATAGTDVELADDTRLPSSPSDSSPPPFRRIPEHALDPVAQWLVSARGAISHNTERALRSDLAIWLAWCRKEKRKPRPAPEPGVLTVSSAEKDSNTPPVNAPAGTRDGKPSGKSPGKPVPPRPDPARGGTGFPGDFPEGFPSRVPAGAFTGGVLLSFSAEDTVRTSGSGGAERDCSR